MVMFRCINTDPNDTNGSMWLGEKEVKSIIPVVDKSGKAHLMVNYYDMDDCINSTKFFEKIEISTMDDETNDGRYIGKYVHAGGELNGIVGVIVDVKEETDEIWDTETWFYVKDKDDGTIHKFSKDDLQEIRLGFVYEDLE